jgi:hypothetical protein
LSKGTKKLLTIVGITALSLVTFGVGSLIVAGASIGSAVGGGFAAISFATLSSLGILALQIGMGGPAKTLRQTGANSRGQVFADPEAYGVFLFGTTAVPLALIQEQRSTFGECCSG